jgi:hypothetical protein
VKALEMLTRRFPDVGWKVCIEQTKPGSRIGHYSYKPRWRSDASGTGQVVTRKEMYDFARKALDLLIAWPSHNQDTLGDLVESLQGMPEEDQTKVWDLIGKWSQKAGEAAKAALRERVRRLPSRGVAATASLGKPRVSVPAEPMRAFSPVTQSSGTAGYSPINGRRNPPTRSKMGNSTTESATSGSTSYAVKRWSRSWPRGISRG